MRSIIATASVLLGLASAASHARAEDIVTTVMPPGPPAKKAAKTPAAKSAATNPAPAAASKDGEASRPKGAGQSIAVLVNDEPITAYEIEQRAAFIALSGGSGEDMKAKAQARWQQIAKDPSTNERFKELLKKNSVTTREQAQALQASFVKDLQRDMMEQLKREQRAGAMVKSRGPAKEELIDEKLKLQEAKRLNAVASDADVNEIIKGIAERNKMTQAQFGDHLKGMGVDISTMRNRFLSELSWREVIRRRFGHLVAISDRDVDRLMATSPGAGEDEVALQIQRITLPLPSKVDQKLIAQRVAEAEGLAGRFTGCQNIGVLAAGVGGAKLDNLGTVKPSAIPEPTRSLLLSASDGDMLPPSVGQGGVELWAVCGRQAVKGDEQKRQTAEAELRQKEFEILAKKHLKDLRQDAAIEYR